MVSLDLKYRLSTGTGLYTTEKQKSAFEAPSLTYKKTSLIFTHTKITPVKITLSIFLGAGGECPLQWLLTEVAIDSEAMGAGGIIVLVKSNQLVKKIYRDKTSFEQNTIQPPLFWFSKY